jgi:hypothetical protein
MSDSTPILARPNFDGPVAPRPLTNARGRHIGFGYGSGGSDVAAQWAADCDRSYVRISEAGGTGRHRDVTVLWVADRRVFVLVNPPERISDAALARSLVSSDIFRAEANDAYLPVEAVLVVGRTVGQAFMEGLHKSFAHMRVYSGTSPLTVVQVGADADYRQGGFRTDGHQRVDGTMTATQRRIVARELADAYRRGWAYPGEPGTGREIVLDDRIRTMELLTRAHADLRERLTADPAHLDLVALDALVNTHRTPGVLVEAVLSLLDLSSVTSVTDLVRDGTVWRAAGSTARTLYTVTGHYVVTRNVATRPARFGMPGALLDGAAVEVPPRVAGGAGSGEFAAAGRWLAETAFDRSRPGHKRRSPTVTAGPQDLTGLRAVTTAYLEVLGVAPDEVTRLTQPLFSGPGSGEALVVEIRETPVETVTGFGRTSSLAGPHGPAERRDVALAMLRRGIGQQVGERAPGTDPLSIEVPGEQRDVVAAELLHSGPQVAREHAAWTARTHVDAVAAPSAHLVTEEDLRRELQSSADAFDLASRLLPQLSLAGALFEPVASLAELAGEMDRPEGPGVVVVNLQAADRTEHRMVLVATTAGLRWADFEPHRLLPAGQIPAALRVAASATALRIGKTGQIIATASPPAAPARLDVRLGGDLLDRIARQIAAGDRRLQTARDLAYEMAVHLPTSHYGTTVTADDIPALAAKSRQVATAVEVLTSWFDQMAALLTDQAYPGRETPAAFGIMPAILWAAAGPRLQDFLVRHSQALREAFEESILTRHPNILTDLNRQQQSTYGTLWTVPIRDRDGLPLVTLERYTEELLNPDPTQPRLDATAVPGRIATHVTAEPVPWTVQEQHDTATATLLAELASQWSAPPAPRHAATTTSALPASDFAARPLPARATGIDAETERSQDALEPEILVGLNQSMNRDASSAADDTALVASRTATDSNKRMALGRPRRSRPSRWKELAWPRRTRRIPNPDWRDLLYRRSSALRQVHAPRVSTIVFMQRDVVPQSKSGGGAPPEAERLSEVLWRASVAVPGVYPGLGPDLFRLWQAPPRPTFLAGVNPSQLAPQQVRNFLRRLDLTGSTPPAPQVLMPATIPHDPDSVWSFTPPYSYEADEAGTLQLVAQPVRELPKIVWMIWFGLPLADQTETQRRFRENASNLSAKLGETGVQVILVTDVRRSHLDNSMVRRMLAWTQSANIAMVNVEELFAGWPTLLDHHYRAELGKLLPVGYVAASDIVRVLLLYRFGGVYTDGGDNTLPAAENLVRDIETRLRHNGYAIAHDQGRTNAAMFGTARNAFFEAYIHTIRERYAVKQDNLYPLVAQTDRESNRIWAEEAQQRIRRNPLMQRTGPDALTDVERKLPNKSIDLFSSFKIGGQQSWLPPLNLDPPRQFTPGEAPAVLLRVVAELGRGMLDRDGDVHLTAVAPIINGLPDPAAAWRAAIRYILARRDVFGPVRTVTDRIIATNRRDAVVDLPADVAADLGTRSLGHARERWVRGEMRRPTRTVQSSIANTQRARAHGTRVPPTSRHFATGRDTPSGVGNTDAIDNYRHGGRFSGLQWWRQDLRERDRAAVFTRTYDWLDDVSERAVPPGSDLLNCFYAAIAFHQSAISGQVWQAPALTEPAPFPFVVNYANELRDDSGTEPRLREFVSVGGGYEAVVEAFRQGPVGAHGFLVVRQPGGRRMSSM